MKLIRVAAACALGLSFVVSGHAGAAAKLPCKLITDVAADAVPVNSEHIHDTVEGEAPVSVPAFPSVKQGPSSDVLDILSADIAADKKHVSVVIRVKKLAVTSPSSAPTGITWYMQFTADDAEFTVAAHTDPTGAQYFDAAYANTAGGTLYEGGVTGRLDLARNEVHIIVETAVMAGQATIKAGKRVTAISVGSANDVAIYDKSKKATSGALLEWGIVTADSAKTPKTYVVGAKNCVTPGK